MSDADLLRQMSDAPMQLAFQAGADALDDNPRLRALNTRLQATIAGLEDSRDALAAELTAIKNPPPEVTVQAGDTLIGIARRHYVQWTDIQAWNGMGTSTVIRPGDVLKLRATDAPPKPEPVPAPQPEPQPQPTKPFVRFVNWWCADGWRDGRPEEHHLDEHGTDSPEVAAYRELMQRTTGTVWSFDTSTLGRDAAKSEASKIDSHRTLFDVRNVHNIRVFFGGAPPTWTGNEVEHRRIAALKPGDSFLFSSMSTDWAAWQRFLANTPDHLRGAVSGCFGHEREADLSISGGTLAAWLVSNDRMFDLFDAAEQYGYITDEHAGKIGLYYSQEIENNPDTPNREQLYGGQDRGWFGEDVYNPRAAKGYRTAAQLVGPILTFAKQIGRPTCIPELGGVRKATDPTGEGRAKMIRDIAAYIDKANAAA